MRRDLFLSPWRVVAFAFTFLLLMGNRAVAFQQPVRQSDQGNADELKLTAEEEKDSYDIYSMLLRTEMPPQWNITGWAIRQETQTMPHSWPEHRLFRHLSRPSQGPEIPFTSR